MGVSGKTVLFLSGPNLQLFGRRQPEVYGRETLEERVARAARQAARHGLAFEHAQSDSEAGLVAAVHAARGRVEAIVVNAGALTHYGWSLHDALAAFEGVIVELHVSNPDAREPWRRRSVLAPVADGTIAGFGGIGYELAVEAVARLLGGGPGGTAAGRNPTGEA
jgi:3-dehydroquinate dehydratase-2